MSTDQERETLVTGPQVSVPAVKQETQVPALLR